MPRTNEQNQEYEVKSILNHASYRNVESCKRDILAALHHYRGLQPKSQKYTFNDGRSRDLICLEGTIPVPYRGASYNIPLSIFEIYKFKQYLMHIVTTLFSSLTKGYIFFIS